METQTNEQEINEAREMDKLYSSISIEKRVIGAGKEMVVRKIGDILKTTAKIIIPPVALLYAGSEVSEAFNSPTLGGDLMKLGVMYGFLYGLYGANKICNCVDDIKMDLNSINREKVHLRDFETKLEKLLI